MITGPGSVLFASGKANLYFVPMSRELSVGAGVSVVPSRNEIAVIGQFNDAAFKISSIDELTVLTADNKVVPLTVDRSAVLREWGNIVSVRFAFTVPKKAARNEDTGYVIRWGKDVEGRNTIVDGLALDPSHSADYREFAWEAGRDQRGDDISVAKIRVIADSNAEKYDLWYLLPMALIMILLTIRKFCANDNVS